MSNQEAHIKMLKYSFDRIKTMEDYNKKLNYLNDFKENGVIDQSTFNQLHKYLKNRRIKIKELSK